jgi:5-methylcytosine-specific restriction endonuclease McrA
MAQYEIHWDGRSVTFPPAGDINPEGVSWAWIRDEDDRGLYDLHMIKYADKLFAMQGKRTGSISVPAVLIPRPDNPFDSDAVSIAIPKSMGGDAEERCLGYLYRHTYRNWGIANDGSTDLVARLAAFSEYGEVRINATMSRDSDPAGFEKYRRDDDEDGWDIPYRMPDFQLDLPKARIMGEAIRVFLERHEDPLPVVEVDTKNTKRCVTCGEYKPLDKFTSPTSARGGVDTDGLNRRCHSCFAELIRGIEIGKQQRAARKAAYGDWMTPRQREYARERSLANNNKRKRLLADARQEPYRRIEIFERDRWICQLCGDTVIRELVHPDPGCASIDHILPISLGGDDTPDNVQLAHLRCNVAKGNIVDGTETTG